MRVFRLHASLQVSLISRSPEIYSATPLALLKQTIVKTRINSKDAIVAATSLASIIANVSDMAQFIPARAAASVVLAILQTVQEIDSNKIACYKLARRSAKLLVDLKHRMEGRWDSAPKALINNILEYEKILVCIRDFMQELSKVKWMGRFFQKGSIETSLSDFHELLSEAEQSFQLASLVEIHYTVGILQERSAGRDVAFVENTAEESRSEDLPLGPTSAPLNLGNSNQTNTSILSSVCEEALPIQTISLSDPAARFEGTSNVEDEAENHQLQEELKELEQFGFKQYHQTDLRLLSEIKSRDSGSFWKQTMIADAGGQRVLVKRYDSVEAKDKANLNRWLRDIKTLRNFYHPNLPQLTGYSDERAPVPFIVLAHAKLRDPSAFFLNALQHMSIAECAITTLKMYRDISSAALYVQRQLSFDERETQVFVAETSYALDAQSGKIIVGIPTPKKNHFRGFGYRLTESLLSTTMQILPDDKNLGKGQSSNVVDLQDKLAHVRALSCVLLPSLDQKPMLAKASEMLLEDAEFEIGSDLFSLPQMRKQSIRAGTHDFAWHAGIHSCPVSFSIGDIGYISPSHGRVSLTDKSRFDHFVKVGNVFDDLVGPGSDAEDMSALNVIREVTGTQNQWINGFRQSNEVWPFVLPEDVEGWPVSISPGTEVEVHVRHSARIASVSEAWRCLLREAVVRSVKLGVDPQELILITKTVSGQIYRVHDWSLTAPSLFRQPTPFTYGVPQLGHGYSHHQQLPRILYLFTSFRTEFAPFLADNPSASAPSRGRALPKNISLGAAWLKPEAFIGYIQLSNEDFASR